MATWGNTMLGQTDYVDAAANRARAQYDAGRAAAIRQAGRLGVNPSSGAFMNMLNNAQYEQTAGVNAAANDAQYKWLGAAQDQFNKDRSAAMEQERMDTASNQWWMNYNAARQAEKAQYAQQKGMFQKWQSTMDKLLAQQNQQPNQQKSAQEPKWKRLTNEMIAQQKKVGSNYFSY